MKKVIILAFAFVLASFVLSSCKSHEKCPAYSKVNNNSTYKKSV